MPRKRTLPIDPQIFFAKVADERRLLVCRKNQAVFSQGDPADGVFYIQKGRVKLTVVSTRGKEAVVGILGVRDFLGSVKNYWPK